MNDKNTQITGNKRAGMNSKSTTVEDFEAIVYLLIAVLHFHDTVACCAHMALALLKGRHAIGYLWLHFIIRRLAK